VQVVQHQHQRALEFRERAPDTRDTARPGGSPWARQRLENGLADRLDAVDRGRDVSQEDQGVVVARVESHPRERTRISLGPSCKKRRLAVPGRRDHGRERRA
jgi:hypothetical protein